MKILTLHSDYIKFTPTKKALKSAEKIKKVQKELKDCLVVFTAVEKKDEKNIDGIVNQLLKEVKNITEQVKADKIVLYPYAHLSSSLASADKAMEVLDKAEKELKKEYKEVLRAPFGWYKQFEVKCKGHPLSEFSREFGPERKIEKERKEESEFHRFILLDKDGKEYEISPEDWREAKIWKSKKQRIKMLKHFVRNELEGNPEKEAPKHVDIMRKLELYDYVPESDVGNLRAYPNGSLIFDLLKDFVLKECALKLGCMKLNNPIMYDPQDEVIHKLVKDFHERDYTLLSEKKEFKLRHSSDVLNFPMFKKMNITYKQMPYGIYELAPSFRLEKRGECVGLKRLRGFVMPDVHFFTRTEEEGRDKIRELCYNFQEMLEEVIGTKWVLGWEMVEDYWEKHKDYFKKIVKEMKTPSFIKLMPEMSHYYAFKNEYQAVGLDGANVQVSTLQLDVKDGERFDIKYLDKDGERKPCYIIHTAPIGSLERCMYLVLENAVYMEDENKAPMLPLWLSPEQVRILPIADRHLEKCDELCEELRKNNVRAGIDDRNESLGKKVFDAKTKWVPYIIVIGDKEMEKEEYPVTVREKSKVKKDYKENMSLKELIKEIHSKTEGLPYRPMYVNKYVSKRLVFVAWSQ